MHCAIERYIKEQNVKSSVEVYINNFCDKLQNLERQYNVVISIRTEAIRKNLNRCFSDPNGMIKSLKKGGVNLRVMLEGKTDIKGFHKEFKKTVKSFVNSLRNLSLRGSVTRKEIQAMIIYISSLKVF